MWECPHNGIEGYSCNHYQDASVICQGTSSSYINCSNKGFFYSVAWPSSLAMAICEKAYTVFTFLHVAEYLLLLQPVYTCLPAVVTVVQSNCSDGDMRLVGGSNEYMGRVEICINQVWGTICSGSRFNRWGVADGRVVCKQLGHQEFGRSA